MKDFVAIASKAMELQFDLEEQIGIQKKLP